MWGTLEQDHERRLAARRRTEQQQQAPSDLGPGARRLEVIDQALEGLVDPEQLVLEQLAAEPAVGVVVALRADHVPDVLVAGARDGDRRGGQNAFEELGERAGPARRSVILAEAHQRLEKFLPALGMSVACQFVHDVAPFRCRASSSTDRRSPGPATDFTLRSMPHPAWMRSPIFSNAYPVPSAARPRRPTNTSRQPYGHGRRRKRSARAFSAYTVPHRERAALHI